jgi:hypothetical protein
VTEDQFNDRSSIGFRSTGGSVLVRVVFSLGLMLSLGLESVVDEAAWAASSSAPRLSITSPPDGTAIEESNLLIRGQVSGEGEIGVTVGLTVEPTPFQSYIAMVNGQEFAINVGEIPVGPTTFVLTATDERGQRASTRITVSRKESDGNVEFRSNSQSGLAPFTADLELKAYLGRSRSASSPETSGSPSHPTSPPKITTTLELDGSEVGPVAFPYELKISSPGIHIAAVRVNRVNTDDDRSYSAHYAFSVLDRAAMEKLLLEKWYAMRDALVAGDIERALTYIALEKREQRRAIFNELKGKLADAFRSIQSVHIISLSNGHAEAEAIRMEHGQLLSYPVVFGVDWPGIWRVVSF